ncbi:DUF4088 family protein [Pandoraea nosoerga]|uniref:DUF4088 domain-containing protein n=1 Tax=Pandoraea nosoerga TaxID=2508296 RepID=A0A5E4WLZ4_9BURK|nr:MULTISPECIES: DUF4088 family protein [Pandoraea]MBN4665620.1 DUF4088 family protein [Pandoraea nosoerga]MBN4675681.1 DUF4088 family protein [Pandoraea nosoerga]MBN4680936.1 DUF4088 family protein [Pandoraea nosoerga]MBN4744660.1 DUF4088 family protein [Pandoraea nosoerga]VVE25862.1 hypothetical protein PNO31109_03374 [Pandoraea nosoerga]
MSRIALTLSDSALADLKKDFDAFVRISAAVDRHFTPPPFDDFLRARLLDSTVPLTEAAVAQLLAGGHYAWAKRTFDKQFPDVVSIILNQARQHGFYFVSRPEWTREDMSRQASRWAEGIVREAKGEERIVESLAGQIVSSAQDLRTLEATLQTPAWRTASVLRERVFEAKRAVETARSLQAREKLGELRALLDLAVIYGSVGSQEAEQILDYLRVLRPELFNDDPGVLERLAAWLRRLLTPARPRTDAPPAPPAMAAVTAPDIARQNSDPLQSPLTR